MPPPTDKGGNPIPEENVIYTSYGFRLLPYGADYLLEHLHDPAHIPVVHDNILSPIVVGPEPMKIATTTPLTKDGFGLEINNSVKTHHQEFKAPCMVSIDSKVNDHQGSRFIIEVYASPSKPGFCNYIARKVIVKSDNGKVPNALRKFIVPLPTWINHLMESIVINQDAFLLHFQERVFHREELNYETSLSSEDEETVQRRNNASYKKLTFSATQGDKGPLLFRDWLRFKAGGRIPFKGVYDEMSPIDKEVVFDQWHSHTEKCQYCLGAYKNAKKVRLITGALAILMAVVRPGGKVASVASVTLLGGMSFASHKVLGALRRLEFSRAGLKRLTKRIP